MAWKRTAQDAEPTLMSEEPGQSNAELDRQARAETEAGIGVPIAEVAAWVESWDTPEELPMPQARRIR